MVAAIAIFIFADTASEPERLVSAFGLLVILGLGFVFSRHPGRVVWRHVVWGVTLQFIFGLLILRWVEVGNSVKNESLSSSWS